MAARQEVRLKEAEAADQKEAANRDTFAEPIRLHYGMHGREVQGNSPRKRALRRKNTDRPDSFGILIRRCIGSVHRRGHVFLRLSALALILGALFFLDLTTPLFKCILIFGHRCLAC
jgi:hypothetical protein